MATVTANKSKTTVNKAKATSNNKTKTWLGYLRMV